MICQGCGMRTLRDDEYHPYAACLMFQAGMSGDEVRATLREIMDKAAEAYRDTLEAEDTICPRCDDEVEGDASGCRDWDCPMRGGSDG